MGTMNHTEGGSWIGLAITLLFGLIAQITLNDFALVSTILAALSTFGYNVYKYFKNRKE